MSLNWDQTLLNNRKTQTQTHTFTCDAISIVALLAETLIGPVQIVTDRVLITIIVRLTLIDICTMKHKTMLCDYVYGPLYWDPGYHFRIRPKY